MGSGHSDATESLFYLKQSIIVALITNYKRQDGDAGTCRVFISIRSRGNPRLVHAVLEKKGEKEIKKKKKTKERKEDIRRQSFHI